MALISISEASKLTGKSRTTLYNMLDNGKLSRITDEQNRIKLDISELSRVFGRLNIDKSEQSKTVQIEQNLTKEIRDLKKEIEHLKQLLTEKDEKVSILKHSLMILEYKIEQSEQKIEQSKFDNLKEVVEILVI